MKRVRKAFVKRRPAAAGTCLGEVPLKPPGHAVHASGPDLPDWAGHVVDELIGELAQVKARLGSKVQIVSWSDCGGMAVEMVAMKQLIQAIETRLGMTITLNHYGYCDKSKEAETFVMLNHPPLHVTNDMMNLRTFETGMFTCATCGVEHELPTNGVDLYV